jgi:hypothetical protein
MLIPQFSLRRLLGITTVVAVIFSIVALGVRGNHWATAVTAGLLALAILLGLYGLTFAAVWAFSLATSQRRNGSAGSPFRCAPPGREEQSPAAPILLE